MTEQHILFPNADDYKWQGDPNVSIQGSGLSVPYGLEAIFSYNGLVMNDLTVFDKYRIMSIDGLADPDIRDTREDKPGEDGEDVYDSYYGGRTIVLRVRVEAYELKKLRDMEEALRTAFVSMEELPLYFLTGDPTKDHYIMCKKSASLTKEEDIQNLNFRHFREWQITLRASDPRFYRKSKQTKIANAQNNYNVNAVNFGNYNTLPIIKIFGGLGNIELINEDATEPFNNIKFSSAIVLSSGDYYEIDIQNRTVVNSAKQNKIKDLDPTSGWIKFNSGNNRLALSAATIASSATSSATASYIVEWEDAWI